MKQLSVFLENKKGELTSLTSVLSGNEISIDSIVIAETSSFGVVRIITSEYERAAEALKRSGFNAMVVDIVAVRIENKKGTFHKIVEILNEKSININYCYNFYSDENRGTFVFSLDNNEKAKEALQDGGFKLIG